MKTLLKMFALCMLLTFTFPSNAQLTMASRPGLFSNFSSNIPASSVELDKAFTALAGSKIQLDFGDKFSFAGTILSSVQKYKNLKSVIIKSPAFKDAILSISKRIDEDNSITYVGRISRENSSDGYQLVKDNSGKYLFTKIKTADLIQDF
ncbi:MAG: hypothetical protein M3R50_08930 [Bacteroidota bacterium]|nr:hypothetical protein [Bacteroidota bacterium]